MMKTREESLEEYFRKGRKHQMASKLAYFEVALLFRDSQKFGWENAQVPPKSKGAGIEGQENKRSRQSKIAQSSGVH